MHETGIITSLIHEVERVANQYGGAKVISIKVRIGALSPFSDSHLLEHFQQQAKYTAVEQAWLVIEHGTDPTEPLAQDVTLLSVEIEDILSIAVPEGNEFAELSESKNEKAGTND